MWAKPNASISEKYFVGSVEYASKLSGNTNRIMSDPYIIKIIRSNIRLPIQ